MLLTFFTKSTGAQAPRTRKGWVFLQMGDLTSTTDTFALRCLHCFTVTCQWYLSPLGVSIFPPAGWRCAPHTARLCRPESDEVSKVRLGLHQDSSTIQLLSFLPLRTRNKGCWCRPSSCNISLGKGECGELLLWCLVHFTPEIFSALACSAEGWHGWQELYGEGHKARSGVRQAPVIVSESTCKEVWL